MMATEDEMVTTDLDKWLTLVANGAVLAGLILVAYEVRQNADLMRVQINQARADAAMLSNQQTFESAYIPKILIKVQQGHELSDEEFLRYVTYFRAQNRNQENVLIQFREGMLGEHIPRSIEDFIGQFIDGSDYSQRAWRTTKVGYSDEYVEFVETTIGRTKAN